MRPKHAVANINVPCSRVCDKLDENRVDVMAVPAAVHSVRMLNCSGQRRLDLLSPLVVVARPLLRLLLQLHDAMRKIAVPTN